MRFARAVLQFAGPQYEEQQRTGIGANPWQCHGGLPWFACHFSLGDEAEAALSITKELKTVHGVVYATRTYGPASWRVCPYLRHTLPSFAAERPYVVERAPPSESVAAAEARVARLRHALHVALRGFHLVMAPGVYHGSVDEYLIAAGMSEYKSRICKPQCKLGCTSHLYCKRDWNL